MSVRDVGAQKKMGGKVFSCPSWGDEAEGGLRNQSTKITRPGMDGAPGNAIFNPMVVVLA